MLRKGLVLVLVVLVMLVGSVSAQDGEPLVVGLLTDQSGPLSVYGYELEYGLKLGLLYAAGIDPSEYDSVDEALADDAVY